MTSSEKIDKASAAGRAALLLSTLVTFIIGQLVSARINNPATSPFNGTIANMSAKYTTGITPSGATFAIWGLIYAWQGIAIIYLCTLLFRKSNGQPIYMACQFVTNLFFLAYSANYLCNSAWNIVYLSDNQRGASVLLVSGFLLLLVAIISVIYSLDSNAPDMVKRGLKVDIWLTRIFVQNGVAIYLGWSGCAAIIGLVVVIHYDLGLSMDAACWIGLAILNTLVVIWFALETFAFDKQMRYVFAHYIAFVAALAGIYTKNFDPKVSYSIYSTVLLVLVSVLALAKVLIMIIRGILNPINYKPTSEEKQSLIDPVYVYRI